MSRHDLPPGETGVEDAVVVLSFLLPAENRPHPTSDTVPEDRAMVTTARHVGRTIGRR